MENYIYHYGIKGQKWKVRRFQNKDGSLTAAGRERYREMTDKQLDLQTKFHEGKAERRDKEERLFKAMKSGSAEARDREANHQRMKDEVNRMQTVKNYRNLRKELYPEEPSKLEKAGSKLETASKLVGKLQEANRKNIEKHTTKERLDLSEMSDKQLRDAIERHRLEDQYNQYFAQDVVTISKGRERFNKIVDGAAGAIAVGTSVVSLALMIKQLKG